MPPVSRTSFQAIFNHGSFTAAGKRLRPVMKWCFCRQSPINKEEGRHNQWLDIADNAAGARVTSQGSVRGGVGDDRGQYPGRPRHSLLLPKEPVLGFRFPHQHVWLWRRGARQGGRRPRGELVVRGLILNRAVYRKWRRFQIGAKHFQHKLAYASCYILGG